MLTKKTLIIVILASFSFLLYFSPYFIFKGDAHIQVHDNIDQLNVMNVFNKTFAGNFFIDEDIKSNNFFPTENKLFLLDEISLDRLLFIIFGYFWGFVVNSMLVRIIGFLGMYLLLERINNRYFSSSSFISLGISLTFVFLPHYPQGNLAVLGIPLIILLFHNLYLKKFILLSYFILFLIPFYSHFALSGFFSELILGCYLLFLLLKKTKDISPLIYGFIIHTSSWLIANYSLFLILFSKIPTHRSEMNGGYIELIKSLGKSKHHFLYGQYHAHSLHFIIILPTICLIILFFIIKKKKFKLKAIGVQLICYNIISSLIYGMYYYKPIKIFIDNLHIGFQFHRFYFIGVSFWYIMWGISLFNFVGVLKYKKISKVFVTVIIILQLFTTAKYSTQFTRDEKKSTFNEIMSESMFHEIKDKINYEGKDYIGCVGFFPSIANYNGFKTIGAYSNAHSSVWKHRFRKIIADELSQDTELKDYYDNWGSRVYLFDNEIGRKYTDQEWIKENLSSIKCDLNLIELSKLGVKYLFSTAKIRNFKDKNLKLLYISDKKYYYRMYVYEILK